MNLPFQSRDFKTEECLKTCLDCHRACLETVSRCLKEARSPLDPEAIRTLLDCADICQASANFILRGSGIQRPVFAACAEICARGAEICDLMPEEAWMEECTEACELCAETCRELALA